MTFAKLTITPIPTEPLQAGATVAFSAASTGLLATINGNAPTWTGLQGASVQANGALVDNGATGTNGWDAAGGVSSQTIASGEGYVEFVANVPLDDPPSYPAFGGRAIFAGLTSRNPAINFSDLDFGLALTEGHTIIYENGVAKRDAGSPRINGVYRVGVEDGQVVFRADGSAIYRSAQPIVYPLRLCSQFYHRSSDRFGGTPLTTINWQAFNESGAFVSGAFSGNTFTAPSTRGRYRIVAGTADFLYASTWVSVQKRYPDEFTNPSTFAPASLFMPQPSEQKWNSQEFDDYGVQTSVAYPNVPKRRRWRLEYTNAPQKLAAMIAALDAFYDEHQIKGYPFFFHDKRDNITYDNCRFERYERPKHRKVWTQSRNVEIVYTPR